MFSDWYSFHLTPSQHHLFLFLDIYLIQFSIQIFKVLANMPSNESHLSSSLASSYRSQIIASTTPQAQPPVSRRRTWSDYASEEIKEFVGKEKENFDLKLQIKERERDF